MTIKLLIIADDFTGALDTGVQLAACGAVTRVITDRTAPLEACSNSCEVLVVDTETRHIPAGEAYAVVAEVVSQAVALGIPHIYKKTDSALRGNVGAELTALLDVSGEKQLPFLPAFPKMGRITVDGIHYIGDKPVAESVFGVDPFDPVLHSRISDLIGTQSSAAVTECPALTGEASSCANPGILVFDASSNEDLAATGARLKKEGKLNILAGCAGFGSVLPELLNIGTGVPTPMPKLDGNFLVICGSVNPITVAQLDKAEKEGFRRVRLTPEQKLAPGYWATESGEQELQALHEMLNTSRFRILDSNDLGGNNATADYAASRCLSVEEVRQAVARSIGTLFGRLFSNPNLGTLLITGGDTLLQCMAQMGISEIQPICELDSGVVLSRFGYQGVQRYVISKSGGFGKEDLLIQLADKIARQ